MALVSLTPTQVAILRNLADADMDTLPVFREFVAAIKQQYGIPADHKLKTGSSDHSHPEYDLLYRKKTGQPYVIDPATGKWEGATPQVTTTRPTAPPVYVPEYRWFTVERMAEIDDIIGTITGDLDFEDGEIGHSETNGVFEADGYKFHVCTDGLLYIELERGEF